MTFSVTRALRLSIIAGDALAGSFYPASGCGVRLASATTIDPLTWQDLVLGADFLAVVECEVAGGIVAKYRVLDGWKGATTGEEVALRISPNAWGDQFRIALCGERFLVAAYKTPPDTMMSTTGYGPVPLWWRRIPADFETPLSQGVEEISEKRGEFWRFGNKKSSLETVKGEALDLLAQPPEKREEVLLKAQAEKYLASDDESGRARQSAKYNELKYRIAQAQGAPALVGLLFAEAARGDEEISNGVNLILWRGGGSITLAAVEQLPAKNSPFSADDRKRIIEAIRDRLRLSSRATITQKPEKRTSPTRKELAKARSSLQRGGSVGDVAPAVEALVEHEPERVAKFLRDWVNPDRDWWDHDGGYMLGSHFAWRCSGNRKGNLSTLLRHVIRLSV